MVVSCSRNLLQFRGTLTSSTLSTLKPRSHSNPVRTVSVTSPFTTSCPKSGASRKPTVGIIGGGISGLSAAYYITKMHGDKVDTVLFEEQDRVGGWCHTLKGENGGIFEMGPRTIRPFGIRGLNTLDLLEEIGLDTEVLFVEKTHDIAKDRFVFARGELVKLPSDYTVLFKTAKPFSRPLLFAVLKDIFASRKHLPDDSIYNFVTRRFGSEIATYLTDPIIRGICAGDSKHVSVKFLMKDLFRLEQEYGSVVLGTIIERFKKKKCSMSDNERDIGFSKVAAASLMGNWAVWGLENGIGSLPERLYDKIKDRGVEVKVGCSVSSLDRSGGVVAVNYKVGGGSSDTVVCDHVITSIGSNGLAALLGNSNVCDRGVVSELKAIEYADLQVTGVRYKGDVLGYTGFGFLVPSCEHVGGLLGVVFDTNCFPQGNDTVLTVMSRGAQLREETDVIVSYVKETLGITDKPIEVVSRVLKSCIPQYGIGHYERVQRILDDMGDGVHVCGNWVDGVSVNDCVFRGRVIARELGAKFGISEPARTSQRAAAG